MLIIASAAGFALLLLDQSVRSFYALEMPSHELRLMLRIAAAGAALLACVSRWNRYRAPRPGTPLIAEQFQALRPQPDDVGPYPRQWSVDDHRHIRIDAMKGMSAVGAFFKLIAAGPMFFVSAWLLMLFVGATHADVGIAPFGYLTSMVVTIGLWLTLAPAVGAAAKSAPKKTAS